VNLKFKLPLILIVSISFIGGCSSTASLSAMKIKPAEQKAVEHCVYLGDVQGSSGFGGVAASQGMENSKVEAREGAAKLGATHIVWSNIVGGYAPSAFGKAYKC
jgi:hypothetical protein